MTLGTPSKKFHYLGKFPNRGGGVNPKSQLFFLKKLGIFSRGGGVFMSSSQLSEAILKSNFELQVHFWPILHPYLDIIAFISWKMRRLFS